MRSIFDRTQMGRLALKNRLIRSATWEALPNGGGALSEELLQIYEELAAGGVGLIITGATDISGKVSDKNCTFCSDSQIPYYRQLTDRVRAYDCAVLLQLSLGDDFLFDGCKDVSDVDEHGIESIARMHAAAAARAQQAGFDGVQIHAAHGYYLSRFISPAYNFRTDGYGGSPERRGGILLRILEAIRQSTEDFHVSLKINFQDVPGGITPAESTAICRLLSERGIDSIEVSANNTSRTKIVPHENEASFLDLALPLTKAVDTPVILVGGHRSVERMNQILNETSIAYLSLSRPLIREPGLPNRWKGGDHRPSDCISCNGCYRSHANRCVLNR